MNFWRQVGDQSITHPILDRFLEGIDPFADDEVRRGKTPEISAEQQRLFWEMVIEEKITSRHLQDLMERKNPFRYKQYLEYAANWRERFKLQEFKDMQSLMTAVKKKGWEIERKAANILKRIPFNPSDNRGTVSLIHPTCDAMGMEGATLFEKIYPKAEQFRFKLCPPAIGIQLCLHKEMENHNTIHIGMEPVPGADGKPMVLQLRRNDHYLLIEAIRVDDGHGWWKHSELEWLFLEKVTS